MRKSSIKAALLASCAAIGGVLSSGFYASVQPAHAQDYTSATLNGQIIDQAGAPVSGATVTLRSTGLGFERQVTANAGGEFRVPQLPIGNYTVSISAPGFRTLNDQALRLSSGGSANYSFAMAEESALEELVVTGVRKRLSDFDSTTSGLVIDVTDLAGRVPVARDLAGIALLAPGATQGDTAFGSASNDRFVAISGSSIAENAYYVNGLNVTNFRTFVGSNTVPFDFYETVEVKTGGYQAEFGRSTGGVLNAITRSGSNEWKAGATITYTPDWLREDAPDTFAAANHLDERETVDTNVWLSGPIIEDHLFFFALVNPRDETAKDASITGQFYNVEKRKDPFLGGKIDAVITDEHRVEFTIWDDSEKIETNQYDYNPTTDEIGDLMGTLTENRGGLNYIGKYTGVLTDWFTVSAAYGVNKTGRQTLSDADDSPVILDARSGTSIRLGDWVNTIVETGKDKRELFRADGDLYFDAFGEHHVRFGYDVEKLTANSLQGYSGGTVYQYFVASGAGTRFAPEGTEYARIRIREAGGNFETEMSAMYIQDSWQINDRIGLQLGLRNETFENYNAAGFTFAEAENQLAPRLGITFDPFGDATSKVYANWGRYFLPIAANTNIRLAGAELDYYQYFNLLGVDEETGLPTLGTPLSFEGETPCPNGTGATNCTILGDGSASSPDALVGQDLDPMYMDEWILGYETELPQNWGLEDWRVGVRYTNRRLKSALDDAAIDAAVLAYCDEQGIAGCDEIWTGFHQYVLINPGEDLTVTLSDPINGEETARTVTLAAEDLGYPKAIRKYDAVEFTFARPFDGDWSLEGSYAWAKSRGNYEGAVKSDNGQDDAGITQDFDQPGLVQGAYGPLPNDRRHTFKLFGSYAVTESITVGANALLQSPRKFGCQGLHPTDLFAQEYGAASWFCQGEATPRGSQFESDWHKRLDVSFVYQVPVEIADVLLRVDVFNVFNTHDELDYWEFGDLDSGAADADYGKVTGYSAPRSIRFQLSTQF